MNDSIISVRHVSHRYSVQWAVNDISFDIDTTGITGLLGSNGAGKSTIMNIICGVLTQTAGDVIIGGVDLRENPVQAKRLIGFLPQQPPLYGDLNVDEYLTYAAQLRQMERRHIPQAVERVKEKCGITHFGKRLIRNLSGGYRQRTGIAQAIVHDPEFVVMDEPTSGLDPNQVAEIRRLIGDIAKEKAVLISTHILSEVQAVCDRIIMIENGSLIFNGTPVDFDNHIEPDSFVVSFDCAPSPARIGDLAGVNGVEVISEQTGRYRIFFDGNRDILKLIVELSVENDWGLNEIYLEKRSMDEIFARLSGKE